MHNCFICGTANATHNLYESVYVCCEHATPPEQEYPLFEALTRAAERKVRKQLEAQGALL